jgi:dipeptidyl aminopeptidase/acylaminoacyl peptidase
MKNQTLTVLRLLLLLATITGVPALAGVEPYPLEYFAMRDVMSNVRVSPDGRYLGLLRSDGKSDSPVLEVYQAAKLGKEPFRVGADYMEITGFYWVSDASLVIEFQQQVRKKIDGPEQGAFEYRVGLVDVKRKKLESFDEVGATVWHLLPRDPDHIILSFFPDLGETSKVEEQFRPRSYYKFDLTKGTKELLLQGKLALGQVEFDGDGHPWLARGFDRARDDYVWYVRPPGGKGWDEVYRLSEDSFEDFVVEGIDQAKSNSILVTAQNGNDKKGLWAFNTQSGTFDELVYRRTDVDVAGVRYHSNPWTEPDTIVGVAYQKNNVYFQYFDEIEEATYRQLEQLIPYAHYVRITSRARDGQTLTAYNIGPKDPGSYYLLKDGQFRKIGSKQPLIRNEDLADVRYITYAARDGRKIPAYLTVPQGEGPFPTVIFPHGGPYVGITVWTTGWRRSITAARRDAKCRMIRTMARCILSSRGSRTRTASQWPVARMAATLP